MCVCVRVLKTYVENNFHLLCLSALARLLALLAFSLSLGIESGVVAGLVSTTPV